MELSKDFLLNLYKMMIKIRFCEESLVDPIFKGEIRCPCHLYSGQEAIAAGLCSALKKQDIIFGTHRSHGHFLARGGDLKQLIAEIYGKTTGCSKGRGGSMHLIDVDNGVLGSAPIVAGTISLALGAALASSIRNDNRVTVSFFGDGATGEGVLFESLNFSALKKLPLLFVCENNFYSTHMSIAEIRSNDNISMIAEPFGIDNYRIDGNDVLEVYKISNKVVEKCRKGEGPVFLEFLTYRQRGHVGPDDNIQGSHTDIRPKEEIQKWMMKDPIKRFENYLSDNAILSNKDYKEIKDVISKEVEQAIDFAKNSSFPKESELDNYVFNE